MTRAVMLACLFAVASAGLAMEGPPPILDPYTVTSPSGGWTLHVNPTDLLGRGPAGYRMERRGELTWTNQLPFTLWEAVVADDGRVAGYAYTHGWRGFSQAGYKAGPGDYVVALLAPDGGIVRQHTEPRRESLYLHTPPDPLALGIALDARQRHFTIRETDPDVNRNRERRTSYSLRNGRRIEATWHSRGPRPARQPAAGAPLAWSNMALQALAVMPLALPARETPALRALRGFDCDETGRIAALRWEPPATPVLVVADEAGTVLREIPLPFPDLTNQPDTAGPAYVGGGRFVVALSERTVSGSVALAWADAATGATTSRAMRVPSITALAGFTDGRCAALTVEWRRHSMVDDLHLLDADGDILWSLHNDAGYGGRPEELLSPEDIARDGTNIVVLDNIRHTLQTFSPGGRLVRAIDLDDVWPRKPNYPTDLAPDRDGGFIVFDFNASNTLVRIDADGRIRSECLPRHPDGTPFRVRDGIKRSPRGDLWTCDGHTLLGLDESGVVTRVLGPPLQTASLATPGHVTMDRNGRTYVADQRTRAVHVFGPDGSAVGRCEPEAADLKDINGVGAIATAPDGAVYVALGSPLGRIHFDHDLHRVGPVKIDVESIGQSWHFAPTGDLCWVSTYHDVFLVQGLTQVVRTISRRTDGKWMAYPGPVSVAPDGTAAISCRNQNNELTVVICEPDGTPRADIPLPAAWVWGARPLFDGSRLFVRWQDELFRFGLDGTPEGRWPLPDGARWEGPFLDGPTGDLLFVDREGWLVRRFRCP
jgi:DNA-binding beta-propeller fold protein YncE